jgi:hypothetical protein
MGEKAWSELWLSATTLAGTMWSMPSTSLGYPAPPVESLATRD